MTAQRVASVGISDGRVLQVVRHPFAVTLSDHPDPNVHSGWTMRVDQARELRDALDRATRDAPHE
jgi:hypothetical protein